MKLLIALCLVTLACELHAADRVALIIGNGNYRADGIPPLSTPVNDARRMAAALSSAPLSFEVVKVEDATRNQMSASFVEFAERAKGAKLVFIYYSGHGIEAEGRNYLIPVDAVLEKPSHVEGEAIELDKVLARVRTTGAEAKVVVLDACRNNPFGRTKSWSDVRGKSVRDLVFAELGEAQLPEATLVCFATSAGRKAAAVLDEKSQNSPFTEFLIKRLHTPGTKLRDIFEDAAEDVQKATEGRQIASVKYDGAAGVFRRLTLIPGVAQIPAVEVVTPATPKPQAPATPSPGAKPSPVEVAKLSIPLPIPPPRPDATGTGSPDEAKARVLSGADPAEKATKDAPFVNSLGMKFVPVSGTKALFCTWETRVKDYRAYAKSTTGVDGTWEKPGFVQSDDHPVVCIHVAEAKAFCAWLSKNEGRTYRLPTDGEWSLAIGLSNETGNSPEEKGKRVSGYPWGAQFPPKKGAGNFADMAAKKVDSGLGYIARYDDGYAYTSSVGKFAPSGNGLYDLSGNVWEWCDDRYSTLDLGVVRGGSWFDFAEVALQSSHRLPAHLLTRNGHYGFRCVLELPGK